MIEDGYYRMRLDVEGCINPEDYHETLRGVPKENFDIIFFVNSFGLISYAVLPRREVCFESMFFKDYDLNPTESLITWIRENGSCVG